MADPHAKPGSRETAFSAGKDGVGGTPYAQAVPTQWPSKVQAGGWRLERDLRVISKGYSSEVCSAAAASRCKIILRCVLGGNDSQSNRTSTAWGRLDESSENGGRKAADEDGPWAGAGQASPVLSGA
jgi:hypothetical protein